MCKRKGSGTEKKVIDFFALLIIDESIHLYYVIFFLICLGRLVLALNAFLIRTMAANPNSIFKLNYTISFAIL